MINKEKLKKEFSKYAPEYDQHAVLQQEVAKELVGKILVQPRRILDLGCGTGEIAIRLSRKYPKVQVQALDISTGMIQEAQKKMVEQGIDNISFSQEDMEFPALPEESFDLIISSLALQWANHLAETFKRLYKMLIPEGFFLFSTLGSRSLHELRESAKQAFGAKFDYGHNFPKAKDIEKYLIKAGFKVIQAGSVAKGRLYDSPKHLLHSLKYIGAQNASMNRSDRLVPKKEMQALSNYYEQKYKVENKIKATYDIIYVLAARPAIDLA